MAVVDSVGTQTTLEHGSVTSLCVLRLLQTSQEQVTTPYAQEMFKVVVWPSVRSWAKAARSSFGPVLVLWSLKGAGRGGPDTMAIVKSVNLNGN